MTIDNTIVTGLEFINDLRPIVAVIPEAGFIVTLDADEYHATASSHGIDEIITHAHKPMQFAPLIPILVQAIKDLSAEVNSLKAETLYLKSRSNT